MTDDATPTDALAPRLAALEEALAAAAPVHPGWADREAERQALLRTVGQYVRPRLEPVGRPALAVVFGGSGAGKSSIVNGLAGYPVGTPGPIRPSTRRAVLWIDGGTDPDGVRAALFGDAAPAVDVVTGGAPYGSVALVDTPPPEEPAAAAIVGLADVGIFVASAGRYADAAAWDFLERAASRGLPLHFVLNRLPPDDQRLVAEDYRARLGDAGLLSGDLHVVVEQEPDPNHGGVPSAAVASLREALSGLAGAGGAARAVRQARDAALRYVARRSADQTVALQEEGRVGRALLERAGIAYDRQRDRLAEAAHAGTLAVHPGRVWAEALADLTRMATRAAGSAAQAAAGAWEDDQHGRLLLEGQGQALWRHGSETESAAVDLLEQWDEVVTALAASQFPRFWSTRRRRRLAAALRRAGLGFPPDGPEVTDLAGDRGEALVAAARRELGLQLGAVLDRDEARFHAAVGDPDDIASRAAVLAEASSGLGAALGPEDG